MSHAESTVNPSANVRRRLRGRSRLRTGLRKMHPTRIKDPFYDSHRLGELLLQSPDQLLIRGRSAKALADVSSLKLGVVFMYFFKGIHREIQKGYGTNVGSYMQAGQIIQGYEEWETATSEERAEIVRRWRSLDKGKWKGKGKALTAAAEAAGEAKCV